MPKYKTMMGKEIDMDKLMAQNELMPAIGNMKVNARGDELGPGGQIIRRREDIIASYYEQNPKSKINTVEQVKVEPKAEQKSSTVKSKKTQVGQDEG